MKNSIFGTFACLRSSIYSKAAELLLVNLLKMNPFRRFEDHLDFELIHSANSVKTELQFKFNCNLTGG